LTGMRPTELKIIRSWIEKQPMDKPFRSADIARDTGLVPRKVGHVVAWQEDVEIAGRDRVGRIYRRITT